jgi:hypothetical protein
MIYTMRIQFAFIIVLLVNNFAFSQYAPQADTEGTTAIYMDSSILVSWARTYENFIVGTDVDEIWQDPEKALGKAQGTSGDILCLGRGGQITFAFDTLIVNKEGPDFATFENSFTHTFLELAWVEVSLDGVNFERFPNYSKTTSPVAAFGTILPTEIHGYCSKYKQGYGTPFDLDSVSLDTIRYVRIIDIVGNGNALDSDGHIIYDPYPTTGSAGVDIDAIGVIHAGSLKEGIHTIEKLAMRIYPQPAKDYIIVEGDSFVGNQIEILNASGKTILKSMMLQDRQEIDIRALECGLYVIKLQSENQVSTQKLIIHK